MSNSWTLLLSKDDTSGAVHARLYEETDDGLDMHEVCHSEFGPFDTALDVSQWLVRHWAPRVKLPLR